MAEGERQDEQDGGGVEGDSVSNSGLGAPVDNSASATHPSSSNLGLNSQTGNSYQSRSVGNVSGGETSRSAMGKSSNALDKEDSREATPAKTQRIAVVLPPVMTEEEHEVEAAKTAESIQIYKRHGLRDSDIHSFKLAHSFGFQSHKRSNIHYLEEHILLTSVGNVMVFFNLKTTDPPKYVQGVREGSIGAMAINPTKTLIAVGEVCEKEPNIYIYRYPSMKLCRVMSGGAVKGYADLCFNQAGTKIASVAMDPDYMLTIWDWQESFIMLRSKAFSQDVYKVAFSSDNDGILTTSGMGHIKFWRMASTFTGLKLQGYLGKFGASELTDIASFLQLPDGKVLSTTETGNLLLWDGGMIKCEIGVKGKRPCHQGRIEIILLGEGEIITAGEDGYVRIWDLETIDNADVVSSSGSEGSSVSVPRIFEMEPIDEISISKDVKIKSLIRNPSNVFEFCIQDQQGQLIKLDLNKRSSEKIYSYHSGAVTGVSFSPLSHSLATLGIDGNLRIYNYLAKDMVLKHHYTQGGTYMSYLPLSLDCSGSTLIAGFNDGVVRLISIVNMKSIVLQYVLKPSRHAIKAAAFSNDGSRMAIGSADGSVFLFHLHVRRDSKGGIQPFSKQSVQIAPLGFFLCNSSITSLSFAPEDEAVSKSGSKKMALSKRLLIGTESGALQTALIPNDADFNITSTFELNPSVVGLNTWHLNVPEKMVVPVPQEEAEPTGSNSALQVAVQLGTIVKSRSQLASQSMLSGSLNSLRKQKGLNITNQARFSYSIALSQGYFIAAVENQDKENEIRLCKYSKPEFSLLLGVVTSQVTYMGFDLYRKHLMVGTKQGAASIFKFNIVHLPFDIRDSEGCPTNHETYSEYVKRFEDKIQVAVKDYQRENLKTDIHNPPSSVEVDGQQWNASLHDIILGAISGVCASFDSSYFVTAGHDGGIFVLRYPSNPVQEPSVYDGDISEQANPFNQPEDIVESSAYSLQEEKLKSEKDREIDVAEAKKKMVRAEIEDLRKTFNEIVFEIESSPISSRQSESGRLKRTELAVDPYLRADIQLESDKKKEQVLKELAWQAEKDSIGVKKLEKKFLEPLDQERYEVHAFRLNASISTYRTLKLEKTEESAVSPITEITETVLNEGKEDTPGAENTSSKGDEPGSQSTKKPNSKQAQTTVNKLEARKQQRAERAAMWKQLMDSKPDDKYQDPSDVAAIRYAIAHMGDYKLKSADNYIVPENERVDADKKRKQILLLNESIKSLKEQFNEKVFALRTKKTDIIGQFTASNMQLREINKELAQLKEHVEHEEEYQPVLEQEMFPENRSIVTDSDITQLQKEEELAALTQNRKGEEMGFSSGAAPANVKEASKPKPIARPKASERPVTADSLHSAKSDKSVAATEALDVRVQKIKLQYRKSTILKSLNDQVAEFDQIVKYLSNEQILLSSDLKFADIKLQLLFREWMLLKEFEQTDNLLAEKLNAKKIEKNEIVSRIDEYREKLNSKKAEIEGVIQKEKEVHDEYRNLVGENNKNEEFLTKVFKKKVKRVKKKVKDVEGEEEDEELSEEEDDLSSYNSDDEENQEFEETIPPECDINLWNKVLELRERRLDQEEILTEVQKAVELLKKENDSFIKKEKIIDMALKGAESEIEDFQTLKQRKLNELDVIVPLRFTQIQHLEENNVPQDFTQTLVFYNEGLSQLHLRIDELRQEKIDIKKQHRELKKQHVGFIKSKKEKEERVAELSAKARDVQMLKFGQVVDLEKLEKLGANKVADEVKEKLQREDYQRVKELSQMEEKIKAEKDKYMNVIKINTECLESIVDLQKQRQNLEHSLTVSQSVLKSELSGLNQKDIEEKERLIVLVQTQASQIDAIKAEIESLIRKPTSKTYIRMPTIKPAAPDGQSLTIEEPQMVPRTGDTDRIIEEEEEVDSFPVGETSAAAE